MRTATAIAVAMMLAVAAAWGLRPDNDMVRAGEFRYADIIPAEFGGWKSVSSSLAQVELAVKRDEGDEASRLYDEILSRSYEDHAGQVVMLSIAYGRQQRQELKIHRPELCYEAQGFKLSNMREGGVLESDQALGRSMLATEAGRIEPVMYWIRIGELISNSAWTTRLHILRKGLAGEVPDGVLVRTSQIVPSAQHHAASLETQKRFVRDLLGSLSPDARRRLIPDNVLATRGSPT